jgi:hypothetical protein
MFYCYVTSNQEYGRRLWRTALFRKREKGDEKQKLAAGVMLETGVQMLRGEPKWCIRREVRGGEVGGCCGWDRRL